MKLSFALGFALVLVGVAVSCGVNYLDLRQFETRIPGVATAGWTPSDASVICQSLKSNDEFSKKYFSPKIVADMMHDYSTLDDSIKLQFQHIRDSVSQKESRALESMIMFFLMAGFMGYVHFLGVRKSQSKKV
ncbi:MAG: hypothetical protein WAO21_07575 [Verrucomicrobiia bacterium]|jgi:hypothetical protein